MFASARSRIPLATAHPRGVTARRPGPGVGISQAQGARASTGSLLTHYPLLSHRLDNGLELIVNPDPSSPAVALNLWYQVGSRDEVVGRTGFAHLFEHLMFEGSDRVEPGEHLALLQSVGGSANATTSFDHTNYFVSLPPHALELALWLEADRMASLAVTQKNLDNQRDVVLEEKRQRYDNAPYGDLFHVLLAQHFPPGHPYAHPTIGSMADLLAAPLHDVQEFHQHWYQPANARLVISGAVQDEHVVELVSKHFGDLPSTQRPERVTLEPLAPHQGQPHHSVHRPVPRSLVALGWLVPDAADPALIALDLVTGMIAGGQTSRLHQDLVRTQRIAETVSASVLDLAQGNSLVLVSATVALGVDPARVEAALVAGMQQFLDSGPTEREVHRAHAQIEREVLSDLASVGERADHINSAAEILGDPNRINTYLELMSELDADRLAGAARTWLQPEHQAVLHYLAEDHR